MTGASSALINQPPKPTKSKESAPEVLSYRQRLYDRETLMLANEPWNPAQRLAQVCLLLLQRRGGGAVCMPARPRRAHRDEPCDVYGNLQTSMSTRVRVYCCVGRPLGVVHAIRVPPLFLLTRCVSCAAHFPLAPTRLRQMRDNYDRLVLELGVSPRGSARRRCGSGGCRWQRRRAVASRAAEQTLGGGGRAEEVAGARQPERA